MAKSNIKYKLDLVYGEFLIIMICFRFHGTHQLLAFGLLN
jgi:hypothetical protein